MKKILAIIFLLVFSTCAYSQTISDFLITNDIGPYKKITKGGPSGNILTGADHFGLDHKDAAYGISYVNDASKMWIEVQVTQHFGGDSDKWLQHEVEDGYRDDDQLNATVDTNVQMRSINETNIYFIGIYGAKTYTWIANNNIVIRIGCSSCPNTKPEPLEIVQAYLTKFPSTITLTDNYLKSQSHSIQWIKKEMDRRLWLCDKWFMQLQLEKVS